MKLTKYVAAVAGISLLLAGCSSSTKVTDESSLSGNSYFAANLANLEKGNYFAIKSMTDFVDGRAWVQFENGLGKNYCALIDSSGKILKEHSQFSNNLPGIFPSGWSYVSDKNYDYMINTNGEITLQNKVSEEKDYLDDIVVTTEDNFYEFYSPDGTLLMEVNQYAKTNKPYNIYAVPDSGIIAMGVYYDNAYHLQFVWPYDGKTIQYDVDTPNENPSFNNESTENNYIVIGANNNQLILMDNQGNISDGYTIPESDVYNDNFDDTIFEKTLWNGWLIDNSEIYSDGPVAFNVVTGERNSWNTKLPEFFTATDLHNGVFVAAFFTDESGIIDIYYLNEKMEVIIGPESIPGTDGKGRHFTEYESDRFAISYGNSFTVYDGKGNVVFESEDKGLKYIMTDFEDGDAIAVNDQGQYVVIDVNGNILFDSIHY